MAYGQEKYGNKIFELLKKQAVQIIRVSYGSCTETIWKVYVAYVTIT